MSFLKNHFSSISKLYINQIGVTIFSFFLYTAVAMVDDEGVFYGLKLATSILSTIFYLFLSYFMLWEIGAKDKIRIDSGKQERSPLKGLLISLFANVPNLLLSLLSTVFAFLMIMGTDWAISAFTLVFTLLRFHTAMFMGIVQGTAPAGGGVAPLDMNDCLVESILFIVLSVGAILFAHFAYWMGSNEYKIFGFITNKPKNSK